jgi:uncharacterized protein YfaS (alpha-2-macroglobulin family)
LNTEGGRDASLEASALAAWLGAVVGEGTAPELYEYVSGDTAQETVLTLLQIGYLAAAMPRMAADEARVAYTLDGERQTEDVPPGTSLALQLTADDLAGLELEVLRGRVGVDVSSLAPIDPATGKTDPNVQVARAYRVQQPAAPGDQAAVEPPEATGDEAEEAVPTALAEPVTDFVDGDLVRVTLDTALAEGADDGCYQLTDLLPSGLVAVTAPSQGDQVYYEGIDDPDLVFPYQVVGQRVSFCVWRDGKVDSLSYLARVITKGSYVAEPAVLQAMEVPESRNVSSSAQITIR